MTKKIIRERKTMRVKDFIWLSGLLAVISLPLSAAENDWPVYGGDNLHQRHSKLIQINKSNVTGLVEAWEFDTGVNDTFQATPVVQDGVMYVSLPFNDVIALDAATGKQLWRYQHDLDKDYPICCGPANRGVAVANGMVFTGTIDARLIALDAKTGKKRWDHRVIGDNTGISEDVSKLEDTELGSVSGTSGAGINMAPMIYQDTVIIGITGVGYGLHLDAIDSDSPLGTVVGIAGKYGRRGFMAGYDIHTGEQKWQFDTGRVTSLPKRLMALNYAVISLKKKRHYKNRPMHGAMVGLLHGVHRLLIPILAYCISALVTLRPKWKGLHVLAIIFTAVLYWRLMPVVVIIAGIISRYHMIGGDMMSPVHPYYLI
jgi:hypothetical protein